MKHAMAISVVWVGIVLGCSGQDRGEPSEAARSGGEDAVTDGSEEPAQARLLDRVRWGEETIDFVDVSEPGREVPEILTTMLGPQGGGEIRALLERQALYSVTPAELWRAVTGREDVPAELLVQHRWQAMEEGRPEELQTFDLSTMEKAALNTSLLFPLDSTGTNLPAGSGSHCWSEGHLTSVGNTVRTTSMCSQNGAFVRALGISTSPCDPSLNANSTLRVGIFNNTGASVRGKICFATGNPGSNQCFDPTMVGATFYYASTFSASGTAHRIGVGVDVITPPGVGAGKTGQNPGAKTLTYGSAVLLAGVPAFSNNSCGQGFPELFQQ